MARQIRHVKYARFYGIIRLSFLYNRWNCNRLRTYGGRRGLPQHHRKGLTANECAQQDDEKQTRRYTKRLCRAYLQRPISFRMYEMPAILTERKHFPYLKTLETNRRLMARLTLLRVASPSVSLVYYLPYQMFPVPSEPQFHCHRHR